MSRIGKNPIAIPQGVQVRLEDGVLIAKGPKGELSLATNPALIFEISEKEIAVKPKTQDKEASALWGLFRTLAANLVEGVEKGFSKNLEFQGVGFKAQVQGDKLVLELGFSHPVVVEAQKGISYAVEKNVISVLGIDKQLVGQEAARIRALKKPEPYKGSGIRYQGEIIKRKTGKKTASGG